MSSGKAQNSYSALPALDALVGFIQDFGDVISSDFSESLKSYIAPRNLEITLSETNKVAIKNYKSGSAYSLPCPTHGKDSVDSKYDSNIESFLVFKKSTVIADIAISAIS